MEKNFTSEEKVCRKEYDTYPAEPAPAAEPFGAGTQSYMSVFRSGLTGFGISQQGQSHIRRNNIPCQDSMDVRLLQAAPIILAAVADGVGECVNSHYGSRTAVQASLDVLQIRLESLAAQQDFVFCDHVQMQQLMLEAFRTALKAVADQADRMGMDPDSFQSTLTVAVYDGSQLYIGHAGDDGLVALNTNNECQMLTRRHKGEASNSVYPLQARTMDFVAVDQKIAAFALMTDGVLDVVVGNEAFGNRVYYPFFQQLFEPALTNERQVQALCCSVNNMMAGQNYRSRVTDDISLVVVTNQMLMQQCHMPQFDQESWDKQTESVTKHIDQQLYHKSRPARTESVTPPPSQAETPRTEEIKQPPELPAEETRQSFQHQTNEPKQPPQYQASGPRQAPPSQAGGPTQGTKKQSSACTKCSHRYRQCPRYCKHRKDDVDPVWEPFDGTSHIPTCSKFKKLAKHWGNFMYEKIFQQFIQDWRENLEGDWDE